jgi:hypothetical protein
MKKKEQTEADEDGNGSFFSGSEWSETPTSQLDSEDCSSSYIVPRDVEQVPDDDDEDSVKSLTTLRREQRVPRRIAEQRHPAGIERCAAYRCKGRRKRGIHKKYYPSFVNQQEQPDAERRAADAMPTASAVAAAADDESSDSDGDLISDSAGEAEETASGSEGDSASTVAAPQQRGNGRYGLRAPKHPRTIEETSDYVSGSEEGDYCPSGADKSTDSELEGEDGSLRRPQ